VFRREGHGDVAPARTINRSVRHVAVDPANELLVATRRDRRDGGPAILIFNRTDAGDAAPKAIIAGPKTGLVGQDPKQIALDPAGRKIFVAIGEDSSELDQQPGFIGVWKYDDNGDVAPLAVIRGPNSTMIRPMGVAVNPRHREIYVVDMLQNALLTYLLPQVF
jgi:DNA-binding beta-propeller fold protein YncE